MRVAAPAEITFSAAGDLNLEDSAIIRIIFKGRELILGSQPVPAARPGSLVTFMKGLGWSVLAEMPGRELVMGAVTKPWEANVRFHPLPPDEFMAFHEPGFVKIAWTLRADKTNDTKSMARTETRAAATDPAARAKFRRYWAFFSPGIVLMRTIGLGLVKREAERRARVLRPGRDLAN